MSLWTRRFILIVPAADRERANTDALQFDAVGGANTFEVGLSPTGAAPATHYWTSAAAYEEVFAGIQALVAGAYPEAVLREYDLDTQPGAPEALLAELGLRPVAGEMQ